MAMPTSGAVPVARSEPRTRTALLLESIAQNILDDLWLVKTLKARKASSFGMGRGSIAGVQRDLRALWLGSQTRAWTAIFRVRDEPRSEYRSDRESNEFPREVSLATTCLCRIAIQVAAGV